MSITSSPAVITSMANKADFVRAVAKGLNFAFQEETIEDRSMVRFSFALSDLDTRRLVTEIPIEAYAYTATIGGI